ncbi:CYFA0S34e00793g1_1 [Cyberlindnera fabianii]|uniref:CYFA0S34e00793g1_1 n=1 Tax=Cyberlindnera fabianii TaxID=36022 RepID=A0A061BKS0_CYBFA|nr:CYFA0S34e00793g1_1 [Cyberlindnera fabianii]
MPLIPEITFHIPITNTVPSHLISSPVTSVEVARFKREIGDVGGNNEDGDAPNSPNSSLNNKSSHRGPVVVVCVMVALAVIGVLLLWCAMFKVKKRKRDAFKTTPGGNLSSFFSRSTSGAPTPYEQSNNQHGRTFPPQRRVQFDICTVQDIQEQLPQYTPPTAPPPAYTKDQL